MQVVIHNLRGKPQHRHEARGPRKLCPARPHPSRFLLAVHILSLSSCLGLLHLLFFLQKHFDHQLADAQFLLFHKHFSWSQPLSKRSVLRLTPFNHAAALLEVRQAMDDSRPVIYSSVAKQINLYLRDVKDHLQVTLPETILVRTGVCQNVVFACSFFYQNQRKNFTTKLSALDIHPSAAHAQADSPSCPVLLVHHVPQTQQKHLRSGALSAATVTPQTFDLRFWRETQHLCCGQHDAKPLILFILPKADFPLSAHRASGFPHLST